MVKQITRWTADTCGCILEYEWEDNGNDQEDKVHTFHAAPHVCGGHLAVEAKAENGKQRVYEAVKRENVNKNLAYKTLIEETDFGEDHIPAADDVKGDGPPTTRRLKPGMRFEYKFTGDDAEHRTLEFEVKDRQGRRVNIPKADLDKIKSKLG